MNIPVLLLIYNRKKETKILINTLKKIKPKKIFISSDGPKNFEKDIKSNNDIKKIVQTIDWTKQVKLNYMKKNYGCKESVSKGISWFFSQVKMGIILEDDCIPSKSFFLFAEQMLKKYQNNKKIYAISGNNFLKNKIKIYDSYYFSKYNHCWGWATWARAWKDYDKNLKYWSYYKKKKSWENKFDQKIEKKYWEKIFDLCKKKKIDSWAYPWLYSIWSKNGICIIPKINLVKNIGFNINASHTFSHNNFSYNSGEINKNLVHPKRIIVNNEADKLVLKNFFCPKNFFWPYRFIYLIKISINNPILFIKILKKKLYAKKLY